MAERMLVGTVLDYHEVMFAGKIAMVSLEYSIHIGNTIEFDGFANFRQKIGKMEVHHKIITESLEHGGVGLWVLDRVSKGDRVYKIVDGEDPRVVE